MANETTKTTLTELVQAAILEAQFIVSQGSPLRQTITFKATPLGKSGVQFPIYDATTAASVAEGTDLANTALQTTDNTVTLAEIGVMTTLTDLADITSAPSQIGADLGKVLGEAVAEQINQDIYGLFDGFSVAIGASNTDITEATVLSGVATLMAAKAPRPYYLAVTPWVFEDLAALYSTSTNITSTELRNQILDTGMLNPIYGVIPVLVDNLDAGTGTGQADEADTKSAIYSGRALGITTGYDIKIETQRDASLRATEIVATALVGVGEVKDTWGVEYLLDNKD